MISPINLFILAGIIVYNLHCRQTCMSEDDFNPKKTEDYIWTGGWTSEIVKEIKLKHFQREDITLDEV